jgi:hypothetical protein
MPATPLFAFLGNRRRFEWVIGFLLTTVIWARAPQAARADDAPNWDPVTPADLTGTQSAAYPDAPAEVLSWKLELDDRNLDNSERKTSEYIRYKIYDPSRAADVTRISAVDATVENYKISSVAIHGRLILPDGTIREFGKESIHERALLRRASENTLAQRLVGNGGIVANEQFLAVEGLQPGAVLEFQTLNTSTYSLNQSFSRNLQKVNIPVRHVDFTVRLFQGEEFNGSAFVGNPNAIHVGQSFDKGRATLHFTADNLPPLVDEPFSPGISGRSVTVFAYEDLTMIRNRHAVNPVRVDPSDGPWAPVAAKTSLIEEDATLYPPSPVISRAKELSAGAASETEKARRIHNFIHNLYVKFIRSPIGSRERMSHFTSAPLYNVMTFDENLNTPIAEDDFLWLEIAMLRGIGLDAQTVLLPDRRVMPFNVRLHSALFLPQHAARVRVDGGWQFSLAAVQDLLPFGWLPWRFQNGAALIAGHGKQQFLDVLPQPASKSTVENTGTFTIEPDGSLTGHARRTLTGEPAIILRPRPRNSTVARFKDNVTRNLNAEFPEATITVTSVAGLNDPEAPLQFEFNLNWPNYATATKTRLIFRPSVIHGQFRSPFAAAERKNAVEFPYHWREIDDVSLQLPDGYTLETPSAPPSAVVGDVLTYKTAIGALAKPNQIYLRREFVSDLSSVPVSAYPTLKRWYDLVSQSDMNELVLAKMNPSANEPNTAAAPATP